MRFSDWSSDVCSSDLLVALRAVVLDGGNGLVRGVLAGDVAEAALDAEVLVYPGDDLVVHVEMLPIGHVGDGGGAEGVQRSVALAVHPVAEAVGHVLDDLEALVHGGRAALPRAGAQTHELRRVTLGEDAAAGRDRADEPVGEAGRE